MKGIIVFCCCFLMSGSTLIYCQITDTVFHRPVERQYISAKYNIGAFGMFVGTEVIVTGAPLSWLHLQCSYRAYEMIFSGVVSATGPHRAGWDVNVDARFHIPIGNTFTGLSIGPYYNCGGGTLRYKERVRQYYEPYYDRFDFRRQIIGGTSGFTYCFGKHRRVMVELYLGAGTTVDLRLDRRPPEHSDLSDHTSEARSRLKYGYRGGICIGYVFH